MLTHRQKEKFDYLKKFLRMPRAYMYNSVRKGAWHVPKGLELNLLSL